MTVRAISCSFVVGPVLAALLAAPGGAAPAVSGAVQPGTPAVNFAAPGTVIGLEQLISPRQVRDPADPGEVWFTLGAENQGAQPSARVIVASDAPGAGLALMPLHIRPQLKEIAASDASVVVERANAFGKNAFRVILPAAHSAELALHFVGVGARPSLVAWSESALIAHNRRAAILSGVVAGLLAAATAFAAGAAVLTSRRFTLWAAAFLGALLFANLTAAGVFDGGWFTALGGPYGLFAFALTLAIAAAIRLVDFVAPFETARHGTGIWRDRAAVGIVLLGVAALGGLPGMGVLARFLAVLGAAGAAGYLAHWGRHGIAGARRMAPAASIFALVTAAAAFQTLGLFEGNLVAPAAIGGFSAAGAMLVALACAAGSVIEHPAAVSRATAEALAPSAPAGTEETPAIQPDPIRSRDLSAVAASHQGVFDLDLETGVVALSAEAAAMLGLAPHAIEIGRAAWLQRIHAEDRGVYEQAVEAYRLDPGTAFRLEFRARGEGGKTRWFELRATMTGQATEADRCFGLIADVTSRKQADAELARAALNDPLTGLGNRIALLDRLEDAEDALTRTTLVVFDLDRFKAVNASIGHDGADTLLRLTAERLTQRFSDTASLFRVGGDMFALVFDDTGGDLDLLGKAVLDMMSTPFASAGRDIFLPASVGVAVGADADDPLDLLNCAELAMIQAKREGGARACVYSDALSDSAPKHNGRSDPVVLETDLRHALERGEIEVHYQPIMRMQDGSVAGFEALLRWRHPERGLIAPEEFVAHSEETGLIVPLGRLALRRAMEDLARWQQFFPLKPPLFASVNVSWRQITDDSFAKELESALKGTGLAAHTLKLEITESAVMADADAAEAALKRLRRLGAGLAIDDFGTGHSSLGHLKRFPFDVIKIDKSFLSESKKNGGGTILASIVGLAHELGMEVVAEGVESEEDARQLRSLGCEYAQGYLFGASLPAAEVTGFIAMTYAR